MNTSTTQYARVLAGDITPGDEVARTRTATFNTVAEVQHNASTVWLIYTTGGRDRPGKTAKWWRKVA